MIYLIVGLFLKKAILFNGKGFLSVANVINARGKDII